MAIINTQRDYRGVRQIPGYRSQQVLAFVRCVIAEHGQAPSYRMICAELGIATPGEVSRIVDKLERRGFVQRVGAGRVRRISITRVG